MSFALGYDWWNDLNNQMNSVEWEILLTADDAVPHQASTTSNIVNVLI